MICGLQTLQETEAGPSSIWTQLSRLGAGYSTVKNSGVLSSQHAQWSFGIHFFIPCSIWLTDLISWYLDYFFSDTKSLGSTELEEMLLKGDDSSHIICWRTQLRDLWNWFMGRRPLPSYSERDSCDSIYLIKRSWSVSHKIHQGGSSLASKGLPTFT